MPSPHSSLVRWAPVFALLCCATPARAQRSAESATLGEDSLLEVQEEEIERDVDLETERPEEPYRGEALASLTFFHYQDDTGLSPLFSVRYRAAPPFRFEAQWGLSGAVLQLAGDRQVNFAPGNPFVSGAYAKDFGDWPQHMTVFGGLGVAAPVANLTGTGAGIAPTPGLGTKAAGMYYALAARGMRDPWLFAPDTATVVVTGAFESVLNKLVLQTSLDIATMFPVRTRAAAYDPSAVFQWDLTAGVRPSQRFEAGARVSTVIVAGTSRLVAGTSQRVQASTDLYAKGHLGGVILSLDFLANMGKPLGQGVLARGDSIWGLTFGVGADLP